MKYNKGEISAEGMVAIVFIALIVFMIWIGVSWTDALENAPCEEFKSTTVKNIPARCFEELKINVHSTEE